MAAMYLWPMQSITLIIVLITAAVSALAFQQPELMQKLQFNPYTIKRRNEWYRFVTHALLHADWMHLIVNMLVLYSFGQSTVYFFNLYLGQAGTIVFIAMYVLAVVASSISTYKKHKDHHWYNAVGASGAVSAVLFSHVLFSPLTKIYLYGILPLPSLLWAALYVGYSVWSSRNSNDNINHEAHLWGAIFGLLFTALTCQGVLQMFFHQIQNMR
jgi:membrane associated rhomboid family serine protease